MLENTFRLLRKMIGRDPDARARRRGPGDRDAGATRTRPGMVVAQLMSHDVATCRPGDTLAMAAATMWQRDIGCLPVVEDDGRVAGIITDRDICMAGYTQGRPLTDVPVSVAMSRQVHTCHPSDALAEVEATMRSRQVRRLPVIDQHDRLAGIVSLNDLARQADRELGRKSCEVSGREVNATLAGISAPRAAGDLTVVTGP